MKLLFSCKKQNKIYDVILTNNHLDINELEIGNINYMHCGFPIKDGCQFEFKTFELKYFPKEVIDFVYKSLKLKAFW